MQDGQNGGAKVLVVDDDSRYLELVTMILENAGFYVSSESQSSRVRQRIAANHPDVVVTDVLMPGMGGVELGKLLKTDQSTAEIPVVYVSAWTGAPDRDLPSGSVRLMKPFTPAQLVESIRSALAMSRSEEVNRVTSKP